MAETDEPAVESVREHFAGAAANFVTSPLYQRLCPAVADAPDVLGLLADRPAGQQPSFLLFGAVHYLLLMGVEHPVREYYASLVERPRDPDAADAAFLDCCRQNAAALRAIVSTRRVQTNVVQRAVALALALHHVHRQTRAAVHLVDIGTSAGLHLLFDRYAYVLGGRRFGAAKSSVTLVTEWRSSTPVPDLDDRALVATRRGVDLHPVDLTSADERLWLQALVWPEDRAKAATLAAAVDLALRHRPIVIRADAADGLNVLAAQLPPGEPRLVFHTAVRMHVPPGRVAAFDAAIDALGDAGPLFHVWLEPSAAPHHGLPAGPGGLEMHGPDRKRQTLALADGHLAWLTPAE